MKKAIVLVALMIVSLSSVLANWEMPKMPTLPPKIVEPVLPCLPDKMLISELTGTFEYTGVAAGGWYHDGSWALEDFQHPTAIDFVTGTTSGTENYVVNYKPSGTEASGNAWKYASESFLGSTGKTTVDTQASAWTVNAPPIGADYTHLFVEELNFIGGSMASSLVVNGMAKGTEVSPTVVQTHLVTSNDLVQERVVKIN